jgi:hypothetical protein
MSQGHWALMLLQAESCGNVPLDLQTQTLLPIALTALI